MNKLRIGTVVICVLSACGSSHQATPDSGPSDTGVPDTGVLDTGVLDTGVLDTGVLDTGPADVGVDSVGCTPLAADVVISGLWTEEAQLDCDTGDPLSPMLAIGELNLLPADFGEAARIEVTWTPFETYVDYWGSYVHVQDGGIRVDVDSGNYIPPDVDAEGCVSLDTEGRLVLSDMWLGTSADASGAPRCGHRFTRR